MYICLGYLEVRFVSNSVFRKMAPKTRESAIQKLKGISIHIHIIPTAELR